MVTFFNILKENLCPFENKWHWNWVSSWKLHNFRFHFPSVLYRTRFHRGLPVNFTRMLGISLSSTVILTFENQHVLHFKCSPAEKSCLYSLLPHQREKGFSISWRIMDSCKKNVSVGAQWFGPLMFHVLSFTWLTKQKCNLFKNVIFICWIVMENIKSATQGKSRKYCLVMTENVFIYTYRRVLLCFNICI